MSSNSLNKIMQESMITASFNFKNYKKDSFQFSTLNNFVHLEQHFLKDTRKSLNKIFNTGNHQKEIFSILDPSFNKHLLSFLEIR